MPTQSNTPEQAVEKLMAAISPEDCEPLIGEGRPEWAMIQQATMAWGTMLTAALPAAALPQNSRTSRLMAASLFVLGQIVRRAYALGLRHASRRAEA